MDGTETNQPYCAILRAFHREMYKGEEICTLQIDKKSTKHDSYIVAMGIRRGLP